MNSEKKLPVLTDSELRVLGSLIEKSKTTPDYYPMTVNAITAACNQKTSRKPVVEYSEETVLDALMNLKAQSLVSTAVGGSIRSVKYKHNFTTVFEMSPAELCVLCLLMLRGAQTPGEINTNSARIYEFASLEEVHNVIEKLMSSEEPFIKQLSRRAGQKEVRYVHLLGETQVENIEEEESKPKNNLEERVISLELEVARMKEILDQLLK